MYRIIPVFLLCLCALAGATFSDCGSIVGHYTQIKVSNCQPDDDKCILVRGKNATIDVYFKVDEAVENLTVAVHGVLAGIPVPFMNSNACENPTSDIKCPLAADGSTYHYALTLPVQKGYPVLPVIVKLELQDQKKKNIVCVLIPAKLQ